MKNMNHQRHVILSQKSRKLKRGQRVPRNLIMKKNNGNLKNRLTRKNKRVQKNNKKISR